MSQSRTRWLEPVLSFASGSLFAVGLAVAGMTQPSKVIGFLDFAGSWDPSLAFVMLGAIAVYFMFNLAARRRRAPLVAGSFSWPSRRDIEPNLVVGASLFGMGWGLAGYCPGPGIASLGTARPSALVFVGAMALGMALFESLQKTRGRRERPVAARTPAADR